MYYELTKLSNPGFILHTSHITIVHNTLSMYICTQCHKTESDILVNSKSYKSIEDMEHDLINALPSSFPAMTKEEQITHLLSTSCGAEFVFNTYNSYEDYIQMEYKNETSK